MSALESIIRAKIAADGPLSIEAFMGLALGHPEYGYYMSRDPFGRGGDFITAPEISQMFGEVLGAWAADTWMKMGSPARFVFLECGPGRGTLMADMMRATSGVQGFHAAAEIQLLEMSPVLKAAQGEALKGFDPTWHAGLESVPEDCPIIVIANEFFDALPVRQFVRLGGGWVERCVDEQGGLVFAEKPLGNKDIILHNKNPLVSLEVSKGRGVEEGAVVEVSPAREGFMRDLCARLEAQTGAALIIDYGHERSAVGDTLQAVYRHHYCGVLEHVGEADLTSHVDFEALGVCADGAVDGVLEQGAFLRSLGIEMRAQYLAQKSPEKAQNIQKDLHRLVNPDEMGVLFKAMGVRYGFSDTLAGF